MSAMGQRGHTDKSAPRFTPNVREAAQNPIAASPFRTIRTLTSVEVRTRRTSSTFNRWPLPTAVLSICLYGLLEAVIMLLVARSEADYTV